MASQEPRGREFVTGVGLLASHAVALVVGLILMIVGIGLGVGLVTLPIAIPVGLVGLFVFLWGVGGGSDQAKSPPSGQNPPPAV
jgi:hypothetical protein